MRLENRVLPLRISWFLTMGLLLAWPSRAWAQTVIATVPVGTNPTAVAVNTVTNKIYVTSCPDISSRSTGTNGTVTVIDGNTNSTVSVEVGMCPVAVAVNESTNKIYVANFGHISLYCGSCFDYGNITIIDGETNLTTTFGAGKFPQSVAVNQATDKIYIANNFSANVTALDGNFKSDATISTVIFPYDLAVNSTTNKIYVTSFNPYALATETSVAVIDGATDQSTTVTDPNAADPIAVAVNPVTNKIYVANIGNVGKNGTNVGSITVIDGVTNSTTNIVDPNAFGPHALSVNPVSDKVYIANVDSISGSGNGGVTLLDGATNSFVTITDPSARTTGNAFGAAEVAVDSATGKVYVANSASNNITVIDGATNATATIADPKAASPVALAVNPATEKIYVANSGSGNITVIYGGAIATSFTLFVKLEGNGSGAIDGNPAGIVCGSLCSASFASGTTVTLTASAASGSIFSGWSGACSGTGTCSVTVTANESVIATFSAASLPDFSLKPASASLTAQRSGQVADVITIAPQNGNFASTIQLSCAVSGPAPMPTCALSPSSVTPGTNPATSTLAVIAPTSSAGLTLPEGRLSSPLYAVLLSMPFALIGLGLASGKSKARRRPLWFLCSLFLGFVAIQTGCGGGSSSQQMQPQNYIVIVTGTSGAIQRTAQVTVTVQ